MSAAAEHDLLAALVRVAAAAPGRPAIEEPARTITYGELLAWAANVGTWLKGQGVRMGECVGLATPRSAAHVAGMLGAWWAGAAFVPVPPELGEARRRAILAGLALACVVDEAELERLRAPQGEAIAASRPERDDLAYVIFTSGSSGRPKGVRIAHRGILSLLRAQVAAFRLGPSARALFVLSTAFDAAISDIGTVLLAGGVLVIEREDLLRDPPALLAALDRRRITAIDLPPALLRHLGDDRLAPSLATVVIGGEVSPPAIVRRVAARVRVVNVYGPTEATVCASLCVCDPETWDRPRLGDPLPGVIFRVLGDDLGEVRGVGESGELAIAGPCLALGYVDPGDEAGRFVDRDGQRIYRSGDRVRIAQGGGLEFLGRVDRQRKLGGVRIELDEIEAHLGEHPDLVAAAVDVDGRDRLVALVEPRRRVRGPTRVDERDVDSGPASAGDASVPTGSALREFLRARVPAAALPRTIIAVTALPRTATGKLDRPALAAKLAELDANQSRAADLDANPSRAADLDASPSRAADLDANQRRAADLEPADLEARQDPAIALLAALWRDVLGLAEVRPEDRFCALGGGSLAALELIAAAEARGLTISGAHLLADASLAEVAAALRAPAGEVVDAAVLQAEVDAACDQLQKTCRERHVPKNLSQRSSNDSRPTILLTGATGALGGALLRALVRGGRVRVRCLVRARDHEAAAARLRAILDPEVDRTTDQALVDPDRYGERGRGVPVRGPAIVDPDLDPGPDPDPERAAVLPLVGDLTRPHLGLDARAWARLVSDTDQIIHAGALVHLALGYPALRLANLVGTQTILELAALADLRALHFISTLSVFVGAIPHVARPREDDDLAGAQALVGGYAQSKWAAERLVRAFTRGRIPTTIHRLGLVTGDTRTGAAPARDQLGLFLRGLVELGVVPQGHEDLRVDITPIDPLARGLASVILDMSQGTDCTTLHLASAEGATAATLVAALRRAGARIDAVPHAAWRARARDLGARSPAAAIAYLALSRALGDDAHRRLRAYDLFQATGFDLAGPAGAAALARHGVTIPPATPELLDRYVAAALAGCAPASRTGATAAAGAPAARASAAHRATIVPAPGPHGATIVPALEAPNTATPTEEV